MNEKKPPRGHLVNDQISASIIAEVNNTRFQNELAAQLTQDEAFTKAIAQIDKVRAFIGSPEKILGSAATKHGEIAEQTEVGIRNARSAVNQENLTATFKDVGRIAPEDYKIDGIAAQSKFINGANANLDHVLKHMDKYTDFGRDGSYYHIPKDHYETITKVINGDTKGLSTRSINAIQAKVQNIEQESGYTFPEVVKPSNAKYAEVQQGNVHKTLDKHEQEIEQKNQANKDQITHDHRPTLAEAAKATAVAGAVGGAVSFAGGLYAKYREGKNPFKGELTSNDWKELGVSSLKGAAGGTIAGGSIYLLTSYASLSAPFAGAVVSAGKGISSLFSDYDNGNIDFNEFMNLGMIVCADSAIVGLATVAGQTMIPIPMIGAVIGSIAGKMMAEFITEKDQTLAEKMQQEMTEFINQLDAVQQKVVNQINQEYDRLGKLTEAAFDLKYNQQLLEASITLAQAYHVDNHLIIHNKKQLDDFMLA
jgi:uncharacterized membrane-anchored protein YhcB (DUF1043 family)